LNLIFVTIRKKNIDTIAYLVSCLLIFLLGDFLFHLVIDILQNISSFSFSDRYLENILQILK